MDSSSKLFGKILLVILPALISGFFAYKIAGVESKSGIKDTNAKAGAGYETCTAAIEKLQSQVETLTLEGAEMKGYLNGLKVGGTRPPLVPRGEYRRFDLPKNLDRALEQKTLPLEAKKK